MNFIKIVYGTSLIFLLLPSNSDEFYEYVFENIKCLYSNLNFEFSPILIFKKSIINSAFNIWPEIKFSTCKFHLRQCWFRII